MISLNLDPELKRSLKTMAWGLLAFIITFIALVTIFRTELQTLGQMTVGRFGYPAVCIGIALVDMFTLPLPPDALLALAVTAGLDPVWTIVWGSVGSVTGGIGAYWLGRGLGHTRLAQGLVAPFRERGEAFIDRLGVTAVIVAALTPIPFSIVCMLAGMLPMRFMNFLPATLFRIPRIAGYYLLIKWGWVVAGGG